MIKEVNTVNIDSGPIDVSPNRSMQMGDLEFDVTDTLISLSGEHVGQIRDHIKNGLQRFYERNENPEPTLAHHLTGLPTMVARLDCTLDHFGNIVPIEVEERPNGVAITDLLVRPVTDIGIIRPVVDHYLRLLGTLPLVAASPNRMNRIDDVEFLETCLLDEAVEREGPVLLRTEPKELKESHDGLIDRSVSTGRDEGKKMYRERTGHAKRVGVLDEMPPPGVSFVLKGIQGSKAQAVSIHLNPFDREELGNKGTITRNRALLQAAQAISDKNQGSVLIEPFRRPIAAKIGDRKAHMILRILATVDQESVNVLGGVHLSRDEVLVHGATNSVAGPVVIN